MDRNMSGLRLNLNGISGNMKCHIDRLGIDIAMQEHIV